MTRFFLSVLLIITFQCKQPDDGDRNENFSSDQNDSHLPKPDKSDQKDTSKQISTSTNTPPLPPINTSSTQTVNNTSQDSTRSTGNLEVNSSSKKITKMSLLGDSIGVGLFSDTRLGSAIPDNSPSDTFVNELINGITLEEALQTIDSTYKSNYQSAFIGKLTSANCFSLACRLQLSNANAQSLAVSASRIDDVLDSQIQNLANDTDLVIVEIGANDFCAVDYNQSNYLASYKQLLDKLIELPNQPLIVILPIPNIPSVFQNAPPRTYSFSYDTGFFPLGLTCGDIRDGQFKMVGIEPLCPRLAALQTTAAADWSAVNKALEALVSSQPQSERFLFVKEIINWSIQKTDLAVDCFHPNLSAHQKLAQILWSAVQPRVLVSTP